MNSLKYWINALLISFSLPGLAGQLLVPVQYLHTSGARELTPFTLNDEHYIAVAQLARDIPNTEANMVGGDADVDVLIFKKQNEHYVEYQRIPGHGNEGATFFTMDNNSYLAIPSIHSGPKMPFILHSYSMLYRWDGHYFYPVQQFYTYAAKQMYYFDIGKRHFLAIANGVTLPNKAPIKDSNSMIYEWNGKAFVPFQPIDSQWGYAFKSFVLNNTVYLAFADNIQHSTLYRWNGTKFEIAQQFEGDGGRAFEYFTINNKHYLAYANNNNNTGIYEWDGKQFKLNQAFKEPGTRNFTYFSYDNEHYLFRVNFITGTREKPTTALQSPVYQFKNGQWEIIQNISTFGGVGANAFTVDGVLYLALANSLSADVRFKVDSVIYEITHGKKIEFG